MRVSELSLKTPMGPVFENVSLEAQRGQLVALFGDAGCGKTALSLCMCGRMKYQSGVCEVGGMDLKKKFRQVRRESSISFVPGLNDVQPFLKVRQLVSAELSLVGASGNRKAVEECLERWHFMEKADVRFDDLNAYDRAYFGIMLACVSYPKLLCVDDVQSNLTQHQSIKLVKILREIAHEKDVVVFFATSEYEIAQHADGIVYMSEGAVEQRAAVLRDGGHERALAIGAGNGVSFESADARVLPDGADATRQLRGDER